MSLGKELDLFMAAIRHIQFKNQSNYVIMRRDQESSHSGDSFSDVLRWLPLFNFREPHPRKPPKNKTAPVKTPESTPDSICSARMFQVQPFIVEADPVSTHQLHYRKKKVQQQREWQRQQLNPTEANGRSSASKQISSLDLLNCDDDETNFIGSVYRRYENVVTSSLNFRKVISGHRNGTQIGETRQLSKLSALNYRRVRAMKKGDGSEERNADLVPLTAEDQEIEPDSKQDEIQNTFVSINNYRSVSVANVRLSRKQNPIGERASTSMAVLQRDAHRRKQHIALPLYSEEDTNESMQNKKEINVTRLRSKSVQENREEKHASRHRGTKSSMNLFDAYIDREDRRRLILEMKKVDQSRDRMSII